MNCYAGGELIFPVLLECCHFCQTESSGSSGSVWVSILGDLAYGKLPEPSTLKLVDGILSTRVRGKELSVDLNSGLDSKEIFDQVFPLLKAGVKLEKISNLPIVEFTAAALKSHQERLQTWATIKKKSIREALIEKYVMAKMARHNFGIKQAKNLLSLILLGLSFGQIKQTDITYSNGSIRNIEGVKILINKNTGECKFVLTAPVVVADPRAEKRKVAKDLLVHEWDKYVKRRFKSLSPSTKSETHDTEKV